MKPSFEDAPIASTGVIDAPAEALRIPAKFEARTPEEICGELCGFPKACVDAVLRFHRTGAPEAIAAMMPGMIEFHLPSGAGRLPAELKDEDRLKQDLGLDSLSLTEMAFKLDELLGVGIEIRELVGVETVGDLKSFLLEKLDRA